MKIVIADYSDSMMPAHEYEREILKHGLKDCEVVVYEYSDEQRAEFFDVIKDADALLTAFIRIDAEAMDHAPHLKVIAINATGYDNVDLLEANKRKIGVCPVGEYCTVDVAEFTISMMMALVKNLKVYSQAVDLHHQWRYDSGVPNRRLEEMKLGIFGFGKIGRQVGKRAKALGMKVIACDPFIDQNIGKELGIELVDREEIFDHAEVITNHMNLNKTNVHFFNSAVFRKMKRQPYFINMGRGTCVVENDLIKALNYEWLKGAALDVLSDETPDLANHPLVGRSNVLISPHAAFYSSTSIRELQRISTENIVYYLNGEKEKVFKLVSEN
ncbi:NAD(P)-dependent oxidoreductase [Enterococcus sp. CWB-B31]|uniref:NAD(P)-dependent oxidoreductase n=1 Tax=Enterococcus sp. CWB-B31 TaxID=2885159 RepID=UPI001E587BBE|nr:NAD(P)-dependent oxidoreductase [Enterococcus sp. CWB-B31]MCB5953926.1 C-terminal binding protein [Enterococcus sp. CWB-B31]